MSSPQRIAPSGSVVASTSGATTGVSQKTTTSVSLSLPSFLIPTRTVGFNHTSNAITIGGPGSSSMVTQSYTGMFTFGLTTWKPTTFAGIASQPVIPMIPTVLGVPPNPFNPFPFGMSHIPQLVPSIRNGYMPSPSYPIYSMSSLSGFGGSRGQLPQSGGYNLSQSFNPSSFNMLGGNAMGVGSRAHPMSTSWITGAFPRIPFLATLNPLDLSKLMNEPVVHLSHWPLTPS